MDLLGGEVAAAERGRIDAHIDECARCRQLLVAVAGDTPSRATTALERRPAVPHGYTPGMQIGRFTILEVLGEGGMGVVLAARDPTLDRTIALKLLRPIGSSAGPIAARERLLREARAMARLSHPNVLTVHDIGTFGDQVFLAIEFAAGGTLRHWLDAAPRRWHEIVGQFLHAARGLEAAHAAGLVHRDFKPDNVLITADGRIRVADFGLVASQAAIPVASPDGSPEPGAIQTLTRTGIVMGTPLYMAPEQHAGTEIGPAADQFAFCVALHEAVHGEHPFASETFADLKRRVLGGPIAPPPPASAAPGWLREVLERGMQREPGDRWPSMTALIGALERPLAAASDAPPLLPDDPILRERVEALHRRFDGMRALVDSGRYVEAAALVGELSRDAAAADFSPLTAQILHHRAMLEDKMGESSAAERSFTEAAVEAARARDDRLAATAWSDVLMMIGLREGRPLAAMMLVPAAQAALARLDDAPEVQGRFHNALGVVMIEAGQLVDGCQHCRRAMEFYDRAYPATDPQRGMPRNNLGRGLTEQGRYRESELVHGEARAIWEAAVGPRHPFMAMSSNNLGENQFERGDVAGAAALHEQALVIRNAWLPAEHPFQALTRYNLGLALTELGQIERATELHEHALAIRRAALGDAHHETADSYLGLGRAMLASGQIAAAGDAFARALAIKTSALPPGHFRLAACEGAVGDGLLAAGDAAAARSHFDRALALLAATFTANHPAAARWLCGLAEVELAAGAAPAAVAAATRAVAIAEAGELVGAAADRPRQVLARALAAAG